MQYAKVMFVFLRKLQIFTEDRSNGTAVEGRIDCKQCLTHSITI